MDIIVKGENMLETDRFNRFCSLLCGATKSINKLKSKYMMHYGLTSAHTMCIRYLDASSDGLTRMELAEMCDIDKAQISRTVNELCAKGYLTETENESNNYRKRLKLTPMGKDTADEINKAIAEIHSFVSDDLSEEQLMTFYSTFDLICLRLKQAEENI
jgi:MarR family transcriptional regulator for hemolysin